MLKYIMSVVLVLIALASGVLASQESSEFMRSQYVSLFFFSLMMAGLVSYLGFRSVKERA